VGETDVVKEDGKMSNRTAVKKDGMRQKKQKRQKEKTQGWN
jgi:hypothetical protein